jgi:cellulose synthase/poly-beta-1,6-N-acetylglucosamine synthase-like glycosyltransferase
MYIVFTGLLNLAALVFLVPASILLVEALAALLPPQEPAPRQEAPDAPAPRLAILIPAHDESAQIQETVRSIAAQVPTGGRLIVIADNCSDDTAERAAAAGATVLARHDPDRRGKGFAISFGLAHLDADPPDVVILIDADCRVSPGGIETLARTARDSGRPIQAAYLLEAPANPSPVAVVSALAILLRNRVRPQGLHRLGFPCHLTGSGMAFPWRVLREAPETGANLVEDLVMGIQLALKDQPPLSCPSVEIKSELPQGREAGMKQRRRWEHGQLETLTRYVPRLLAAGVGRGRAGLVALGLDLMVPPLALLVMAQGALLAATVLAALIGIASSTPVALSALGLAAVATAVMIAWIVFGRRTLPLRHIVFIPFYVLWKIPLYLALLVGGRQKKWERTARQHEEQPRPEDAPKPDATP